MKLTQKNLKRPLLALLAVLLLSVPLIFSGFSYAILICCFILLYVIAVSGLDIVFGYCGQISMGHAAFFAIGAYGSCLLHDYCGIPIMLTMVIAAVLAALVGAVIAYPASKLVFHFLSLATLSFGEIVYQIISHSPGGITNNFVGYYTESINFFGLTLDTYPRFYYYALGCAVLFLTAKQMLVNSKVGRAFIAIRENHHAADGMGVNVRKYKVIAFAVSAFYTAFAGSMYPQALVLGNFLLSQFSEAVNTGDQRQAAPIVPGNSDLSGIVHIPHSASYSGFYRCIGVIHAVQHNSCAGWITAPSEFHLTAAGKWHIHLGSPFSDSFINRVRIHSPSSPWHRKPCPGKGHPSHSWNAVQTGFSVCAGGPVWERYSGLVLFGLELAWFGFFTIYLHFLQRPF